MAKPYDYLTHTGVMVPDTATVLETIQNEWRSVFGNNLSVEAETPQGVLMTADALGRNAVIRNNAALANQINPNQAGGVFLDAICALTGLERAKATRSTLANVDITGVPHTFIDEGARARTQAGDLFSTISATRLSQDGTGKVDFHSVEYGPIAATAGALVHIVDNVLGWETVYNAENATLGQSEQSDESLRAQRKRTLALQGISLSEAITSALSAIEGVKSLQFRENTESVAQIIDGVSMKPHSIWVCVDGGMDTDIAQALLKNKSAGAGWNGAVALQAINTASGQAYSVLFDRPTPRHFLVCVKVRIDSSVTDPQNAVRDAITTYAENQLENDKGFRLGTSVSPFELATAVNRGVPGIYVQEVKISNHKPVEYVTTEIKLNMWEKAFITPSAIQVVVL
ncbi:baseplate J/gp47 family protein [Mycoavidus sp. SF9855]|uniref:baseplate J/gp47 family protein n=1 Tax=Mycoavidus sp. SF9855 TaxID=2968475 RepID=UPI00211C276C|nr:baseplate J/gp47 family protein [Mycoavidus sp. SF9855]UUM20921.1 baseplate J/gp47 family protein [Mycoavidus sp. SF9855]